MTMMMRQLLVWAILSVCVTQISGIRKLCGLLQCASETATDVEEPTKNKNSKFESSSTPAAVTPKSVHRSKTMPQPSLKRTVNIAALQIPPVRDFSSPTRKSGSFPRPSSVDTPSRLGITGSRASGGLARSHSGFGKMKNILQQVTSPSARNASPRPTVPHSAPLQETDSNREQMVEDMIKFVKKSAGKENVPSQANGQKSGDVISETSSEDMPRDSASDFRQLKAHGSSRLSSASDGDYFDINLRK